MPFVRVTLKAGRSAEKKAEMGRRIIAAVAEIASVAPSEVWVAFDEVSQENWHSGPKTPAG
ncbi:MAG: tautomerase family protein [Dongiaceae bacterium]